MNIDTANTAQYNVPDGPSEVGPWREKACSLKRQSSKDFLNRGKLVAPPVAKTSSECSYGGYPEIESCDAVDEVYGPAVLQLYSWFDLTLQAFSHF